MNGLLQSFQNVTGWDRPTAAAKAVDIDWDNITYRIYSDLLDVMSFEELEHVGGLQYDPLAVKYRKAVPAIVIARQQEFANLTALVVAEKDSIIH